MKCVNYVVNCLAFSLVFGCGPSPKNTKTTLEKPVYKKQENKTTHQHVALKTQDPHKHEKSLKCMGTSEANTPFPIAILWETIL